MANLKIIWTTGAPFSSDCREKIGYQINSENWNIYTGSYWVNQTASVGEGNRPATAEEIEKYWDVLRPMWTPESGDKVIVTQDMGNWRNKRGTIVNADGCSEYWIVKRDHDDHTCSFKPEDQMILAPYEETAKSVEEEKKKDIIFNIGDTVIPDTGIFKDHTCFVVSVNSTNIGVYCPTGKDGHSLSGDLNGDDIDKGYYYNSSNLIHKEVKFTSLPESVFKKKENLEPRFKVGDKVTYRSKASCNGYRYGGDDHDGYVGTITSYGVYRPEYDCYGIHVTCKEGGNYYMLESEFYEYNGLGLSIKIHNSTSGSIGIGTSSGTDFRILSSGTANAISLPLDTWGIHFHKTSSELKEEDALAKYSQAPVTLHKKPKRKLIIVNTY